MTAIEQMYDTNIKPLSTGERLQIARMILNDIPNESSAGYSDHWSEEDLRVATRYSLQRADVRIETGAAHCLVPVGFATADCRLPTASP